MESQPPETQPTSRFRSVDENLLCSICRRVPLSPLMGKCEHICCPTCIDQQLHKSGSCPVCKREMQVSELAPPGRIIQELYRRLEISCDYHERGCTIWTKLADWAEHVNACPKAPLPCSNTGCKSVVNRENYDEHRTQKCEHRIVGCELCRAPVSFSQMKTHLETACPRGEVECTCGRKMLRADKQAHDGACRDRAPLPCPVAGCGQTVPQGEMEAHLRGQMLRHMRLMMSAIQERDTANAQLQQEMGRLKVHNENTQKRLNETKASLTALQNAHRDLCWYGMGSWQHDPENKAIWIIGNMNQRMKEANLKKQAAAQTAGGRTPAYVPHLLWSPQFYTASRGGYRFSLRIDLGNSPNVGLFVHLHEGEFDDQLDWPFNLDYTVQLGSVVSHITQRDSFMHYSSQGRPPHEFSWGWANFCTMESFKEAIANDALTVSVLFYSTSMTNPAQAYHAATAGVPGGPTGLGSSGGSLPHLPQAGPGVGGAPGSSAIANAGMAAPVLGDPKAAKPSAAAAGGVAPFLHNVTLPGGTY